MPRLSLPFQAYIDDTVKSKTAVLWNLELDTLRGDLGLLGLPPKDIHYSFLSYFKPAFYVRQRDYSKSVAVAPFIVNYSGCLFREYPGPWQVMLRQDNGEYACIAGGGLRGRGIASAWYTGHVCKTIGKCSFAASLIPFPQGRCILRHAMLGRYRCDVRLKVSQATVGERKENRQVFVCGREVCMFNFALQSTLCFSNWEA